MFRASPCCSLIFVTVAACRSPEGGGLDTAYTSSTSTDTGESGTPSETESDSETGTDTDDPPVGEPLHFIAAGSMESVVLALDLTDPQNIPEPQYLAMGEGSAALLGPTPFGSEIVVHDGDVDHLRMTPEGQLELAPLVFQENNWLDSIWFGDDGANALVTTSTDAFTGANTMLWAVYDDGELVGSWDLSPPKDPTGQVSIWGRSPDSSWAAAAVDIQGNGVWDLYLLPINPEPGATDHIDHLVLTGIPPASVKDFLSLHLDDERIVYRRETLPMIDRPVAIALDNPGPPVDLGPNLQHTYSITPADTNSRLLVTTGGEPGYRVLWLIELDGPTSALDPVMITDVSQLALENSTSLQGVPTNGHGFDALGRIYYAWANASEPESVGIALVTAGNGQVTERLELANIPAGATIHDVVFDPQVQLLGYRVQAGNQGWISYIDLSADQPAAIRVQANFEHDPDEPENDVGFAWSADGSRIAVVGLQQGLTALHVAEIGDATGVTTPIEIPDVEATPGYTFDHRPSVGPEGDQLMLWYGTQAGRKGLVHALTDGSTMGQVVLAPQHSLTGGTFLPRNPQ